MVLNDALDQLVIQLGLVRVQVGAAGISQVAEGEVGGCQEGAGEVPVLEDSCMQISVSCLPCDARL